MVVKFKKGYDTLREEIQPSSREMPDVYWYWGATGTGKSRACHEQYPDAFWYTEYGSGQWWDGYRGQSAVILDDIRPESFQYRFLLRLFDRYPLRVGIKGSTIPFTSNVIVVTAPKPPEEFFENYINEDIGQLTRRLKEVKQFH